MTRMMPKCAPVVDGRRRRRVKCRREPRESHVRWKRSSIAFSAVFFFFYPSRRLSCIYALRSERVCIDVHRAVPRTHVAHARNDIDRHMPAACLGPGCSWVCVPPPRNEGLFLDGSKLSYTGNDGRSADQALDVLSLSGHFSPSISHDAPPARLSRLYIRRQASRPRGCEFSQLLRQQTNPQKLQLTHMQLELFTDVYVSTSHLSGRGLFVNRHR